MRAPAAGRALIAGKRGVVSLRMVGWREWIALPDLEIPLLKAKVDTGARTSALHAVDIEPERGDDGRERVRFSVPEEQVPGTPTRIHSAPVRDRREVRNSGGAVERRYVVATTLHVADRSFVIELTLTDRSEMGFAMLLGRNALRTGRLLVHPSRSFLQGRPV